MSGKKKRRSLPQGTAGMRLTAEAEAAGGVAEAGFLERLGER
jgi:hypothetical protein